MLLDSRCKSSWGVSFGAILLLLIDRSWHSMDHRLFHVNATVQNTQMFFRYSMLGCRIGLESPVAETVEDSDRNVEINSRSQNAAVYDYTMVTMSQRLSNLSILTGSGSLA